MKKTLLSNPRSTSSGIVQKNTMSHPTPESVRQIYRVSVCLWYQHKELMKNLFHVVLVSIHRIASAAPFLVMDWVLKMPWDLSFKYYRIKRIFSLFNFVLEKNVDYFFLKHQKFEFGFPNPSLPKSPLTYITSDFFHLV